MPKSHSFPLRPVREKLMMALNTKASGNVPPGCFLEKGIRRSDTLSGCLASQTLIKAWRDKQSLTAMTDRSHVVLFSFQTKEFVGAFQGVCVDG